MATYTISIHLPDSPNIVITQLVQALKEAVYTRAVSISEGAISDDYKKIQWNIEGSVTFHDIHHFINSITHPIREYYSYSITHQNEEAHTLIY